MVSTIYFTEIYFNLFDGKVEIGLRNLIGESSFILNGCRMNRFRLIILHGSVKNAVEINVFNIIRFSSIELAQIDTKIENLLFIFLIEDYFIMMLSNVT